jgi:hypothetical protein
MGMIYWTGSETSRDPRPKGPAKKQKPETLVVAASGGWVAQPGWVRGQKSDSDVTGPNIFFLPFAIFGCVFLTPFTEKRPTPKNTRGNRE